jgi:GR25 family glycosyltransferase involved in LPS biosynthesis
LFYRISNSQKKRQPLNYPVAGVVINLERSSDRRKSFFASAAKQKGCFGYEKESGSTTEIEIIQAIDGKEIKSQIAGVTDNEYACIQSHLKALKYAKKQGFECVAIFEDDVLFTDSFSKDFQVYLSELPDNFHILYLGGSFGRPPQYYDKFFSKQVYTWGAFAYVVHKRAYTNLINILSKANKIVDAMYIDYQKQYLCIKPNKKLVIHPQGVSTIKEKFVNYQNIV